MYVFSLLYCIPFVAGWIFFVARLWCEF